FSERDLPVVRVDHPIELARRAEVEHQADFKGGGTQVIHYLCAVTGFEPGAGLDFDDHQAVHDDVEDALANCVAAELDDDRHLLLNVEAGLTQRDHHYALTQFFEEAVAELVVRLVIDANDLLGEIPMKLLKIVLHADHAGTIRATRLSQEIARFRRHAHSFCA